MAWPKGKPRGPSSKEGKTYEQLYGAKRAEKICQKISNALKGKPNPKVSEAQKGRPKPPRSSEHCQNISKARKGKSYPKISEGQKGKPKPKVSKAMKANWQNPEYVRKQMKSMHANPNKPETKINNLLKQILPGEYEYVGDGKVTIDGLIPDFINHEKKKIIEHFGIWWHRDKGNISYCRTEKGRRKAFAKFGYDLLIIWENELENPNLMDRILEFNRSL